jgi:hypothetical protein
LLKVGRAQIRPANPGNVSALVADGRICGVLVSGRSSLRYLVEDRFSLPLAQYNLRGLSDGVEVDTTSSPPIIGVGSTAPRSGIGLSRPARRCPTSRR